MGYNHANLKKKGLRWSTVTTENINNNKILNF